MQMIFISFSPHEPLLQGSYNAVLRIRMRPINPSSFRYSVLYRLLRVANLNCRKTALLCCPLTDML